MELDHPEPGRRRLRDAVAHVRGVSVGVKAGVAGQVLAGAAAEQAVQRSPAALPAMSHRAMSTADSAWMHGAAPPEDLQPLLDLAHQRPDPASRPGRRTAARSAPRPPAWPATSPRTRTPRPTRRCPSSVVTRTSSESTAGRPPRRRPHGTGCAAGTSRSWRWRRRSSRMWPAGPRRSTAGKLRGQCLRSGLPVRPGRRSGVGPPVPM